MFLEPPPDPRPRPAREITIAVRKQANRDNANYAADRAAGRPPPPACDGDIRWWQRVLRLRPLRIAASRSTDQD